MPEHPNSPDNSGIQDAVFPFLRMCLQKKVLQFRKRIHPEHTNNKYPIMRILQSQVSLATAYISFAQTILSTIHQSPIPSATSLLPSLPHMPFPYTALQNHFQLQAAI